MTPLIWTTKGNLPIADLEQQVEWDIQDTYIKLTERYIDQSGEVVKESAHVYDRLGISGQGLTSF